jgi:hypothetical protein
MLYGLIFIFSCPNSIFSLIRTLSKTYFLTANIIIPNATPQIAE